MQTALRAAGLPSAGRTQAPRSQRACVSLRACTSPLEAPASKEQHSLALATFLASSVVAVASAAPAFADEAIVAAIGAPASEVPVAAIEAIDGGFETVASVVAPALEALESLLTADATTAEPTPAATADADANVPATTAEAAPVTAEAEPSTVATPEVVAAALEAEPAASAAAAEAEAATEAAPAVMVEAEAVTPVAETPAESVIAEAAEASGETLVEVPEVAAEQEAAPAPAQAVEAGAGAEVEAAPVLAADAQAPEVQALEVIAATKGVEAAAPVLEEPEIFVEAVPEAAAADDTERIIAPAAVSTVEAAEPEAAMQAPGSGGSPLEALQGLFSGAAAGSGGEGPTAETLTYVGLGAAAASFVGTFVVAPRFRDEFKEPVDWKEMYTALSAKGVKTVTVEEAYAKAKKGAVLLDVRLADKYNARNAVPSVNVPLYQPIAGWDAASNVRRAGFAFFGIFGTELNENFAAEVQAKVPKGKEVLVMCETGGSLENKPGTQFGFQSRSLKAIYYLQQAGYTKILHVKGGLADWQRAGLPLSDRQTEAEARPTTPPRGTTKGTTSGSVRGATAKGSTTSGSSGTRAGTSNGKGTTGAKANARELVSASGRSRR